MNTTYPSCLLQELRKYGQVPSGNLDWDRAVLDVMKANASDRQHWQSLHKIATRMRELDLKAAMKFPDMADEDVYNAHARFFMVVASRVLAPQRRQFIIDDDNRSVIRFLLLYFNGSSLCEEVFPDRGYKLHKNILIQGGVGVGKTMLMQIFSEYLRLTGNPRFFHNVSVTQMVNYYSINNNIDRYLYNDRESRTFQGAPVNLCLNDIGVDNRPFYGIDTDTIIHDFLHARNEIWANASEFEQRFAHLTTNLDNKHLREKFSHKDSYGRIIDRFKTYNVIPLTGQSRR